MFPDNVCRLCLWKTGPMVALYEKTGDGLSIAEMINTIMPFKVSSNDDLPKDICPECYYKVEVFYAFLKSCVQSNERLSIYFHTTTRVKELKPCWKFCMDEIRANLLSCNLYSEDSANKISSGSSQDLVTDNAELEQQSVNLNGLEEDRQSSLLGKTSDTKSHSPTSDGSSGDSSAEVQCDKCMEKFPDEILLSLHNCDDPLSRKESCLYCGLMFADTKELLAHENGHIAALMSSCTQCGKEFERTKDFEVLIKSDYHTMHAA